MNSPLQSRLISPNLQWSGPGSGWVPSLLLNYPRDPWPSPVSLSCLLTTRSEDVLKPQEGSALSATFIAIVWPDYGPTRWIRLKILGTEASAVSYYLSLLRYQSFFYQFMGDTCQTSE